MAPCDGIAQGKGMHAILPLRDVIETTDAIRGDRYAILRSVFRRHDAATLEILERIEGGKHQISKCAGAPAVLSWATGNLPEPKNNPQVGMVNMRAVMTALQKAKPVKVGAEGVTYASVALPKQQRQTRIVKDASPDDIAKEIVEWIEK